jgi:AraC-like DNA-binding protein
MEAQKLFIRNFTRNQNRGYASIIDDPAQLPTLHSHDYFELFLVYKGNARHSVNGEIQPLSKGCIAFVRPDDVHCYIDFSKDFQIINIMVSQYTMESLFSYLGEGFEPQRLLTPRTCPLVRISPNEFSSLVSELEHLVVYKEILKERSDAMYKITIMNIITRYFPLPIIKPRADIPVWLRLLSLEMLKKENFVDGLQAMYRLSGKSIEHLSRSYRKYLNKSPTQFINEIRVKHSAKLIMLTDDNITDICYEVGFNNLSNYYHLFKKIYGMSPKQFRKNSSKSDVNEEILPEEIMDSNLPHGISPFGASN